MYCAARQTAFGSVRAQTWKGRLASHTRLSRLLSSLAVLEQKDGALNIGSLAAVTAAQKLGGSVSGFIAGGGIKPVAEAVAKVKGLDKVIYVDSPAYDKVAQINTNIYVTILNCFFTGVGR